QRQLSPSLVATVRAFMLSHHLRRRPPRCALFPYTTLFRSQPTHDGAAGVRTGLGDAEGERADGVGLGGQSDGRTGGQKHGAEDRSEEHTSELQSRFDLVCRLLLEKKKSQLGKTAVLTVSVP